ncbi:hypothetical protein NAEGRDRAFT_81365 [Naegleria gruberi]|uniref:Uncharacterized protein n=1 Tax=Naegleria gruberi TaxID=5762 RepID=D2VVE8_NAEGR|nr:uncharacterized protein NAEGRDRAFT_81365 [Naegleria gruberi]EFC39222.1 hypothetical protein NAEGRDRAFT_81365 [Naegleria gruberi]|eukprot:XP_002671966.1 hypothetical protein NAEGRDRAFT_81365 [Naegleria gruberi strain NEG-M]
MILRYPPLQQQTNSSSCSLFPSQFDSPFPVMNSNTNNTSNFISFIHHSTEIENENNSSLMNDEPPCTPCSTWLSLTSLHQLSFNSNNNLNPNCNTSDMTSLSSSTTTTTSCTISSNSNESQLMPPPPSFQFPTSIPSNISAKDLFEEEFRLKCSKYRKVNEATRSVSSLTPCSSSSAKSLDSNEKSSQDMEPSTSNNSPQQLKISMQQLLPLYQKY